MVIGSWPGTCIQYTRLHYATVIQKSLSLTESVSLCVFLLPLLVQPSALWLSLVPTLQHERIACVMVHASVFSSSSPLPRTVFIDSSHTLSISSSVAFHLSSLYFSPHFLVLVFYVTNILDKSSYQLWFA